MIQLNNSVEVSMSNKEVITLSRPASNANEIKEIIHSENSKPIYDAVLATMTKDYQQALDVKHDALKRLIIIESSGSFSRLSDIIQILTGLVEAGLIKSKYTAIHDGRTDRLIDTKVEYCLL